MPTYVYECPECQESWEMVKPIARAQDVEICKYGCKKTAEKVIQAPRLSLSTCQFQAHYNWGLGKEVHSKRQISEELHRIKGETGRDIVEVGNDKLESIK